MSVFEVYLACIGATIIIAYSKISLKVKGLLRIDHVAFFGCPQCLGFWVGIAAGVLMHRTPGGIFVTGLVSSFLSLLSASVISWLDNCE